ncbi:hypothetical protein DFP72DRAFT_909747 [Ephemerocybe angulata]|uniref:Uncharacterized protein n=1 Tax=Ephemerocybe angulata TaxID=980116 RepID=A0A8H6HQU6_9AGAR|nr:hypothetical protein DFP72DRAFT_909747 [Tulosesus angulatus]
MPIRPRLRVPLVLCLGALLLCWLILWGWTRWRYSYNIPSPWRSPFDTLAYHVRRRSGHCALCSVPDCERGCVRDGKLFRLGLDVAGGLR